MRPITLTERRDDRSTRTIYVNPDRIERFFETKWGTVIVFGGSSPSITVTESTDDVWRRLLSVQMASVA